VAGDEPPGGIDAAAHGGGAGRLLFYVTPSFSFSEVYDDNLLSTPSHAQRERQQDFISRISPNFSVALLGALTT
jgi:hypothetical protein